MGVVDVDVSQVKAFAAKLKSVPIRKQRLVTAAVKHGAQNIKTAILADVRTSSNRGISRIPVSYEMKESGTLVEADIAPPKGGAGNLANIAFFGTSRGGGTHRFYEHGEEEFETTAKYVREAASTL
ncbi:hypothetical protein BLI708_00365 [Bifidobacterium imperatoris]|uniref:HK97 gp10 family phage protein n=2 Tax=Bifidobacterium imperatoris TaxID=2020965 RepID=A0A2N5IP94_9BIFI|nr:hypothetical protein [Bifidobacterium imperatoris]PLS23787.1 hypothetical protein Tam1G_2159 [Bifidobacterium imperatoris]QSY57781.1 hypothetical protein BLI708_00065 [Bifidobacterium imperatoris]QSY57831.1 hypothetical protein BLI708_00365 [Bifidobacterium imperatoris]